MNCLQTDSPLQQPINQSPITSQSKPPAPPTLPTAIAQLQHLSLSSQSPPFDWLPNELQFKILSLSQLSPLLRLVSRQWHKIYHMKQDLAFDGQKVPQDLTLMMSYLSQFPSIARLTAENLSGSQAQALFLHPCMEQIKELIVSTENQNPHHGVWENPFYFSREKISPLTALNLSGAAQLPEETLLSLIGQSPSLKTLNLAGCRQNLLNLALILKSCPQLQELNVERCYASSSYPLKLNVWQFNAPFLNLISLNLAQCVAIGDEELISIAKHSPHLTHLNLNLCKQISDAGLEKIALFCPNLKSLKVSGCDQITPAAIRTLVQNCPALLHIEYLYHPMSEAAQVYQIGNHYPHVHILSSMG